MNVKQQRKMMRGNIVCSLRYAHNMTYREIAMAIGVSRERANQIVKQYEAAVLRKQMRDAYVLLGVNDHIQCLGDRFVAEATALCESLNGETK